jgi:hypothetical protein
MRHSSARTSIRSGGVRAAVVVAALAALGGGLAIPPAVQAADPNGTTVTHFDWPSCPGGWSSWQDGNTFGASCNTSRRYHAVAECHAFIGDDTVYGATASNGVKSYAYCSSIGETLDYGYPVYN